MIVKERLAALPMAYCINRMTWRGRSYCITASEDRAGEVLLIDIETKGVQKIQGLAGGVMSILPVPEEEGTFLAIQRFYPVFDSREAEIVCCRLEDSGEETLQARVETVTKLPYVHRIALTGEQGRRHIVAATLCADKAFQDDWSKPGAVYDFTLDPALRVVEKKLLLDGIHKNHGMYEYRKNGGLYVLVSGEEGVWAIDARGAAQKLCDESIGDLCMYDVDGDGIDELLCIAPFHGSSFRILKRECWGWKTLSCAEVDFGHAVWCGPCGDRTVAITCSRGGDRCIRMYIPSWDGEALHLECADIDVDVGASNINVDVQQDQIILYAADHGRNEIARYTITI